MIMCGFSFKKNCIAFAGVVCLFVDAFEVVLKLCFRETGKIRWSSIIR